MSELPTVETSAVDLAFLDRVPIAYEPTIYAGPDRRTNNGVLPGRAAVMPLATHRAKKEYL